MDLRYCILMSNSRKCTASSKEWPAQESRARESGYEICKKQGYEVRYPEWSPNTKVEFCAKV